MNLELTNAQETFRSDIKNFALTEIAPQADDLEKKGIIPDELLQKMATEGLFSLAVPTKYGGGDVGTISLALAIEEVSRVSASLGCIMAIQNAVVVRPLIHFGTSDQKDNFLTLAGKGTIGSFALTEAQAGSDASKLETTAIKEDTEYVINGVKRYTTNTPMAGFLIVMAMTDKSKGARGISVFLVERNRPGWAITKTFNKLGIRAAPNNEVTFSDCRVPRENLLGEEGQGFKIALSSLDFGRIGIAAQAVGIAQAALDASIVYAKEREQFGQPLANFQGISFPIAEMGTRIEAARLLVHRAAYFADKNLNAEKKGKRSTRFSKEAAMAKLFASETAMWVTTKAIQIHGGIGYMADCRVERYFRDAKITEIYEGTSEIQRIVISRFLLS